MRNDTYSKILMAPLFMLLAVACSPNQFNQSTEYDDVYFTSSDRSATTTTRERSRAVVPVQSQEKTAVLEDYSTSQVDEQIVTKYNNGTDNTVTYYEPGPIVQRAQDLNYDDFVADYNNQQLAYYELPLDWNTDWNRQSFNRLMADDFHFQLAWYDQYYRGQSLRMSQYLTGSWAGAGRRGFLGGPRVGLAVGFNNVYLGFSNMTFVDLNPWGWYDPFWQPIGFRNRWGWNRGGWGNAWAWNGGWGWNNAWNGGWGWNDPFWCPPVGNRWGGFGWRNGWRNNVFVNNNIIIDRRADSIIAGNNIRDVRRGPRVGTRSISTVRNEAINGSAPTTRSQRYVDNLDGDGSVASRSRSGRANTGRATTTTNSIVSRTGRAAISNGRTAQTRTGADRYSDNGRSSRSSYVRSNGSVSSGRSGYTSRSSRSSAGTSNQGSRSSVGTSRSSSGRSNPSFSRGTSSRSYTSRTSRSSGSDSYARSSGNSRNSYSRGRSSSSSRSSYSRSSSSRSSSRSSGSYSRGSSSRSSSGSRSMSRGSSSRSSSRSSGSISRGSSSRSSGSRSSSSRSSSSRSGRGS